MIVKDCIFTTEKKSFWTISFEILEDDNDRKNQNQSLIPLQQITISFRVLTMMIENIQIHERESESCRIMYKIIIFFDF